MPESTTLTELTNLALKFRADRDWQQFHNPKDVALSMSLEVAELVEIMQWRNGVELQNHLKAEREHVGQELSDILGWVLLLAHDFGNRSTGCVSREDETERRKISSGKSERYCEEIYRIVNGSNTISD